MELITKGVLINSLKELEIFSIKIKTTRQAIFVKEKLKEQKNKAISILKKLKITGEIKSIYVPKNKMLQKDLNRLVQAKRIIKKSIEDLNAFFT